MVFVCTSGCGFSVVRDGKLAGGCIFIINKPFHVLKWVVTLIYGSLHAKHQEIKKMLKCQGFGMRVTLELVDPKHEKWLGGKAPGWGAP